MPSQRRDRRTDVTDHVAEELTSVLDFVSRLVRAGDESNLSYMQDKANQLVHAARGLLSRLSELPLPTNVTEPVRFDHTRKINGARLRALVARWGRHYEAARLLYPIAGDPRLSAKRHALESAAVDLITSFPALGITPAQASSVADWLVARAPLPELPAETDTEG